jgi:hypothetical protein
MTARPRQRVPRCRRTGFPTRRGRLVRR